MSFLRRIVKGASGGSPLTGEERTRLEAVERICSRLQQASLLEDRRSAAQALKSVSKQYQREIGTLGWTILSTALQKDYEDEDVSKCLVETMIAVLSFYDAEEEGTSVGLAEVFLKEANTLIVIMTLLKEANQSVRYGCLQLLTILHELLPHKLPGALLHTAGALSTLTELLDDRDAGGEVLRGETILLLARLTEENAEVQRVAAFEGAFERLVNIVLEGYDGDEDGIGDEGDGRNDRTGCGVFVNSALAEDALTVMDNMLRYNPANQKYFQESSCLTKLQRMIKVPAAWKQDKLIPPVPPQVVQNYVAALKIVNALLDQDSPRLGTTQLALHRTGILGPLVDVALSNTIDATAMRKSAFLIIGAMCRRQAQVQTVISQYIHEETSSKAGGRMRIPLVLAIIKIAVGSRKANDQNQDESLRAVAVQMLGSYLEDNADGQLVIAATFRSPKLEGSADDLSPSAAVSAGSAIIEKVSEIPSMTKQKEVRQSVFAALLLAHILRGNKQVKQLALDHRVSEDESLLGRILLNLPLLVREEGSPTFIQMAISHLVLLCTWIDEFPPAARQLLSEGSNVHLLMELFNQNSSLDPMIQGVAAFLFGLLLVGNDNQQPAFTRSSMENIVKSRVGTDVFFARICRLRNRLRQLQASTADGLELSHESSVMSTVDKAFAELFLERFQGILNIFLTNSDPKKPETRLPTVRDQSIETIDLQGADSGYEIEPELSNGPNRHEKNLSSKCNYLSSENGRLASMVEAFRSQLLEVEKDREELLTLLSNQDNELKELRQRLALPPQGQETADVDTQGKNKSPWMSFGLTRDNSATANDESSTISLPPLLSPQKPSTATHDV